MVCLGVEEKNVFVIRKRRRQEMELFAIRSIKLTLALNGVSKFVSNDSAGIEYCCVGIELYGFCNASAFEADPQ